MTFKEFILSKFPLYKDVDFSIIHTTWGEAFKLYEDYMKDNQPIVTVEMHEPNAILIGEPFRNSQDNHFKTNG